MKRDFGTLGSIELLHADGDEAHIADIAGVCVGREMDARERPKLIRHLLDSGHMTPFEFCNITLLVECPLFVRSQWHRHRSWAYNEMSRRHIDASNARFYTPTNLRYDHRLSVREACDEAMSHYRRLVQDGVPMEQARMVLPQNMLTVFAARTSLRHALDFLRLRCSSHAQGEIRTFAMALVDLLEPRYPTVMRWFTEQEV